VRQCSAAFPPAALIASYSSRGRSVDALSASNFFKAQEKC
jgi:hypothetical protein